MKLIKDLQFGFRDAENYRAKDYKELFNKIFVRTEDLEKLCRSSIYFLLGEKGTGKTALAMFLNNNEYNNITSKINFIRETEYQKFIKLKNDHHLELSTYTSIWKVIIYLLMSYKILDDEKDFVSGLFGKFDAIVKTVNEYYKNAFSPEIITAMDFVESSKISAEILARYLKLGGTSSSEVSFTNSSFQLNLFYLSKQFEEALKTIKLKKNHLLFIDGIDIRPRHIPYEDYLDCIKGLANAIWEINNDMFSTIKDSKGRMRVVLLMRPDIFSNLGLQNLNNKYRDNSVLLDWRTDYPRYRKSPIFIATDKLLESQQESSYNLGECWDYYFPFKIYYKRISKTEDDSFIAFLRNSLFRPRDIIAMLELMQNNFNQKQIFEKDVFKLDDIEDKDFIAKYSDYRLGEIKDHLAFYYDDADYDMFMRFFTFMNGKFEFTYQKYLKAFDRLMKYIKDNKIKTPAFCETPDFFLQFLYESNVICYLELTKTDDYFMRWCFKERDYSNISPKVKTNVTYRLHYSLSKALNVGKELKR